jgi:hypothetical protein
MRPNPNRGRVYRRCACRNDEGKQIGTLCAKLANPRHGTWAFAVDRPTANSKRKTMRRSGFSTKAEASQALSMVLDCERTMALLIHHRRRQGGRRRRDLRREHPRRPHRPPRLTRQHARTRAQKGNLTGPSPVDRDKPGSKIHAIGDRGGL